LVDPQQLESDGTGIRGTNNKLIANNPASNHQIRPQVAESSMPVVGPLSKVARF
jgi:transcription initiation factor TFIID subunit 12